MSITDQDITTLRKVISKSLSEKFHVNQISVSKVPQEHLHFGHEWESDVYAFQFIINNAERYITFCAVRNGKIAFTRTKEGIQRNLAGLIRPHDFGLVATGDFFNRNDVIGKFIECRINLQAREVLEDFFGNYSERAKELYDFAIGYQITRRHKATMTFDCDFELIIKESNDIEFITYTGEMLNGNLVSMKDPSGKTVKVEDVII